MVSCSCEHPAVLVTMVSCSCMLHIFAWSLLSIIHSHNNYSFLYFYLLLYGKTNNFIPLPSCLKLFSTKAIYIYPVSSESSFSFLTIVGAFFITARLSAASYLQASHYCPNPRTCALNNAVRSEELTHISVRARMRN